MTMQRHEAFEELISASLNDELSPEERRRLDLHLDGCASCRETLAAFADQRRIVAGLRSISPPRDLGARVRTGIEMGAHGALPWWRRPVAIFAGVGGSLALVAGALLALVLLNADPRDPQVGQQSPTPASQPTPQASAPATPTPVPTLPPLLPPPPSPGSSEPIEPSVAPIETPVPTNTPSPQPDVFLAVTGPVEDRSLAVVDGTTGETVTETEAAPIGEPIAAELSSDGQWLAYISRIGESGLTEVSVMRIAEAAEPDEPDATPPPDSPVELGEQLVLGTSIEGSPFLERLAWSPDSRYLAFTLADPDASTTDVFVFEPALGEAYRFTETGSAYAASWAPADGDRSLLWISTAGEESVSHLQGIDQDAGPLDEPIDPSEDAIATAEHVFLPLLSPNGKLAMYWTGRMAQVGGEWVFSEGGAPYLSEHPIDGDEPYRFTNERPLFSDVTIDRDAFTSAAIAWGPDGDSYAVWDAIWTGIPQAAEGAHPDPRRVYFGHATDPRGLTATHAIDEADIPDDTVVVDVKPSPSGGHLVVTVLEPTGGVLEAPRARLLLIERNTGDVADEVRELASSTEGWVGPAAFVASVEDEGDR